MSDDAPASDTPASDGADGSGHDSHGGGSGWWHWPSISFSMVLSVIALGISSATFYLTRVQPADIAAIPAAEIAMWWNGVGGGTNFQWIDSRLRLPLVFANDGARRLVVREVRLSTEGSDGTLHWNGARHGNGQEAEPFVPFQLDGGGTVLRTIEFVRPGSARQALRRGAYRATVAVRRDLSTEWEPLVRFRFAVERTADTRLFGIKFGYPIVDMERLN